MSQSYVHVTSDLVPFVVTPIVGTMRCRIPVVPGGDGAERPLEERTDRCVHRAECLIGTGPICAHHYEAFFRIAKTTPKWKPEPCPR